MCIWIIACAKGKSETIRAKLLIVFIFTIKERLGEREVFFFLRDQKNTEKGEKYMCSVWQFFFQHLPLGMERVKADLAAVSQKPQEGWHEEFWKPEDETS